jgi:ribosomal protein S18 acetylase RimI-like enzyme
MEYQVALELNPEAEDVRFIQDGLTAYNLQFAPPNPFVPLSVLVRDAGGTLVGGLLGGTFWGWLQIDYVWFNESARHQGLGERVVAMAEQEARTRGCHHAFLDTESFQARGFYEKQGYVVHSILEDFPTGDSRIYLQKEL